MSLNEFYNHIVQRIEHEVRICDVMEWDGETPFTDNPPLEFTESDYYYYAVELTMKYAQQKQEGKINYYQWKKHMMGIFIMLDSFLCMQYK